MPTLPASTLPGPNPAGPASAPSASASPALPVVTLPPLPGPPAALGRSMTDIASRSSRLVQDWLARQARDDRPVDALLVGSAFLDMTAQLIRTPAHAVQAGIGFWQDYMTLWQSSARRMWGMDPAPPQGTAPAGPRASDAARNSPAPHGIAPNSPAVPYPALNSSGWNSNDVFGFIKQSYLLSARYIQDVMAAAAGLDPQTAQRLDHSARQFIAAMSPANFLLTNPEALRRTASTGGENLLRGLAHLLADLEGGRRRLLSGAGPNRLGRDVAATPGKVVFQNAVMQLIQYAPSTPAVLRRPLLVVPPWTSKFYALDLQPRSSLVRWAVAQGHTVFLISWANPAPPQPGKPQDANAEAGTGATPGQPPAAAASPSFDDYIRDGVLAALDAIAQATGEHEVNAAGYAVGGTLLAAALAWMAATGDSRIRSASFFATLLDFSASGGLGVLMDEEGLRPPDGQAATTTGILRTNDLMWSFVVNTYLLGTEPFPVDLLHWNADTVQVPPALQAYYLQRLYRDNLLRQPGGLTVLGHPLDLGRVGVPTYALATREDHIAPWTSAYRSAALLGGDCRFVLAGSGHVAGVVNPPGAGRYSHWLGTDLPDAPEAWLAGATEMAGSWWPDWHRWLLAQDARTVPARIPGAGALPTLEDAPGSYVLGPRTT